MRVAPLRRFVLVVAGDRLVGGLPVEDHRWLGVPEVAS